MSCENCDEVGKGDGMLAQGPVTEDLSSTPYVPRPTGESDRWVALHAASDLQSCDFRIMLLTCVSPERCR